MITPELTACFTGHRPSKLPGGYDYMSKENIKLKYKIENIILELIAGGTKRFLCGGAIGVDQMACEILLDLRDNGCDIYIELAIPFKEQYIKWQTENKQIHQNHIDRVDKVTYVDCIQEYQCTNNIGKYDVRKLNLRNRYMVDNSDIIIAIWNGESGGTADCVKYATRKNKKIITILP